MLATGVVILVVLFFILVATTLKVWIWAGVYVHNGAPSEWNDAVYFSLVTYSTLGYGDITLAPGICVFGAFASVTGVLAIGLGTAFLIALMSRMLQDRMLGGGERQGLRGWAKTAARPVRRSGS